MEKNLKNIIYLSGIVDGEGYVSVIKSTEGKYKYVRYREVINIKMNDNKPIKLFHKIFGGYYYKYKAKKDKNISFCCRLNGKYAVKACRVLLPYLLVKFRNAKSLINFYNSRKYKSKIELEKLYLKCKKLNHKKLI